MHLTHDLTISAKGNESLFINGSDWGKAEGTKERKLERGNRANREIQSNYRRNTSELENKVLSLVLPFPVSRCYSFIRLKRSFPRQEISSFFFFFLLFFDLPLIFTRLVRSMRTSFSSALKALRMIKASWMIIMIDTPCEGCSV